MSEVREQQVGARLAWLVVKCLKGWKVFVFGTVIPVAAMAIFLVTLPNEYKATSLMIVAQDQKSGALAKLSSIGGGDLASLAGLDGNSDVNTIFLLASSRALAMDAIRHFGFAKIWQGDRDKPLKREELQKLWIRKLSCLETPIGGVEFSYEDTSATMAAEVVKFTVHWVDSAFTHTKMKQASASLDFINSVVEGKKKEMELLEDSLLRFQRRNRVYLPNEQLVFSTKAVVEFDEKIQELDLEIAQLRASKGKGNSQVLALEALRSEITRKMRSMQGGQSGEKAGLMLSPSQNIGAAYEFQRLFRNIERQAAVYKLLIQQQELLMVDAKKNTPVLTIIDVAVPPEKKSAPPKGMILQAFFVLCFAGSMAWIGLDSQIAAFWGTIRSGLKRPG